jgi:DNA-binding response OmpR family regulator
MKRRRTLVVEDDDQIKASVEDTLFSLGHGHVWVTNQADAQEALKTGEFDYALLDLEIPARAGGDASAEFGLNLLRKIRRTRQADRLPVILMAARRAACVDLFSELMRNGVNECISKPFPNRGRTLASVIRMVLGSVDGQTTWLTVTECARMLCKDLPGLRLDRAKARVSRAASAGKFETNGKKSVARRIESVSFNAWRLALRDRDLDSESA